MGLVPFMVLAVLVLTVFCWADLGRSSNSVSSQVKAIVSSVDQFEEVVKSGDATAPEKLAESISEDSHELYDEVRSPSWYLSSLIPVIGADARCAQKLSAVFVKLSDEVLLPISSSPDLMSYADMLGDSSVDLAALRRVSRVLSSVAPALSACSEKAAAVPKARDAELARALDEAREGISSADSLVGMLDVLLPSLPNVLGADGQSHTYLVVTLNNADLRSCGGLPAAWTLITVTDGNLSAGKTVALQQMSDDFLTFEGDELAALPNVDDAMGYLTALPDFSRVGRLMAEGYEHFEGKHIDGVIAVDAVFLHRLLELTGGVTASDGTVIDGSNASWALMSDACWRYEDDGWEQDRFFAETAALVHEKSLQSMGSVNPFDVYALWEKAAEEGRLSIWMEDEALESVLASLGFAGTLSQDVNSPVLGIFLNDETWGRLGWYVQASTDVSDPKKNADGSMTYHVEVTVTNAATKEELEFAPRFIWGFNEELKQTDTDMVLSPLIVAPAGSVITNVSADAVGDLTERTLYGRPSISGLLHLDVGESFVISFDVSVPKDAAPLAVQTTPLARDLQPSSDSSDE